MELQTILYCDVVIRIPIDETILLTQFSLIRKRCFTLIVNAIQLIVHHLHECLCNHFTAHMHTHGMGLHDSSLAIYIYDKPRKVIAFTMYKTVSGVRIRSDLIPLFTHNTYRTTYKKRCTQSVFPKLIVNSYVMERQNTHGDGANLEVSDGNELVIVRHYTDNVTFLKPFFNLINSSREDPRVETKKAIFLSPLQIYLLIHK